MKTEIREASSNSDIKKIVNFYFKHYSDSPMWVPPLKRAEIISLQSWNNPAFQFCDSRFWLAYQGNKIVGTIGAIVNHKYIKKINENVGRFSRFECINDPEVANLLLSTAENWLRDQGMIRVHGPLGFTNLDTQGMLIEGFDYLQSIGSVYHKDYYKSLIESYGFEKEIDWVEFRLTVGENAIKKASRGAELVKKRYGIEVIHFKSIEEVINHSRTLFKILNKAFAKLPYVIPFTADTIAYYEDKYIKFLNPEYCKMVKMNDQIIGFVVGMPSMSKAFQKAKGKMFPFGFMHLLKAQKGNVDTMDQMLTGVLPEYQSTGAAVVLMAELQKAMLQKGMKYIETTGIFETNHNAISNWKNYEHIQHKRRRCFTKAIK